MQADQEPMLHIEKSCDCGRNRADRYVRAGVSQRTAPAMISRTGGSETDAIQKQSGTLLAMTTGTLNDTPALDALKASCGAPISMGRGEIPVRLTATSRLFCLRDKKQNAKPWSLQTSACLYARRLFG